jgi:hypothetical protein
VVLDGVHVIDVTWRFRANGRAQRVRGEYPAHWCYLGISPLAREAIWPRAARLGMWCSAIDCMEDGFPLLRQPRLTPPAYSAILGLLDNEQRREG